MIQNICWKILRGGRKKSEFLFGFFITTQAKSICFQTFNEDDTEFKCGRRIDKQKTVIQKERDRGRNKRNREKEVQRERERGKATEREKRKERESQSLRNIVFKKGKKGRKKKRKKIDMYV